MTEPFPSAATHVVSPPHGGFPLTCPKFGLMSYRSNRLARVDCCAARRVVETAAEEHGPERKAGDRLVQILAGPLRQTRVNRLLEVEVALGDPTGGCDHDDHDELWLKQQHLDAYDGRRLERRRGHERE